MCNVFQGSVALHFFKNFQKPWKKENLSRRCGIDTGLRDCMSEVGGEFETAVHGCKTDFVEFMNALHDCKAGTGEYEAALHGYKSETGAFEVALHGSKPGEIEAKVHGCMLEWRPLVEVLLLELVTVGELGH